MALIERGIAFSRIRNFDDATSNFLKAWELELKNNEIIKELEALEYLTWKGLGDREGDVQDFG